MKSFLVYYFEFIPSADVSRYTNYECFGAQELDGSELQGYFLLSHDFLPNYDIIHSCG